MIQLFIQERSKGRGGERRERREGRGGQGEREGLPQPMLGWRMHGVFSEGFTTVMQPAANAGAAACSHGRGSSLQPMQGQQPAVNAGAAAFLVTMALEKFQGAISAATPTGCLITRSRLSFSLAVVNQYARFASSANHITKDAPYLISSTASAKGLP